MSARSGRLKSITRGREKEVRLLMFPGINDTVNVDDLQNARRNLIREETFLSNIGALLCAKQVCT